VVAFHRVTDTLPEDGITRGARAFEQFCQFFRANFQVVTLGDFVARLERRDPVGGMLAITFDDGYLDNFEIAAPVLERLSLPATFFVATRLIDSKAIPWWDAKLPKAPAWMTWQHVRELSRAGFDIGAHTQTHVDLGTVSGGAAEADIEGSRRDLLEQLGREPRHFAFPYGGRANLLEENRRRVMAAGFRCCVSCHGGIVVGEADPFQLPRVPISPWYRTANQFGFEVVARRA